MKTWKKVLFVSAFLGLLAVCATLVLAQSTGYRFTQNGLTFAGNGTVCFEPTYNAGPDVCIERSGIGHLSILSGNLAVNPDITGQVALVGGTKTITFANAYTAAPLALCTDLSATATAVGCHTTTTTLVINGTSTDTINYLVLGNPN